MHTYIRTYIQTYTHICTSIQGGATTFVDGFAAAEKLRSTNPDAFKTLTEIPATFQKIHYDRAEPVHMHTCTHICTRTHTYIRAHAHTRTHTLTHTHMHLHAQAYTHAHTHARTHTHKTTNTYAHEHTHIQTHLFIQMRTLCSHVHTNVHPVFTRASMCRQ